MAKPLEHSEIENALAGLEGWSYGENFLYRSFRFADFREAMAFLMRVAFIAESLNHHPHIENVYSSVVLKLQTHDAGDRVTELDVKFAEAVNALDS